jgi:hypothetical protein
VVQATTEGRISYCKGVQINKHDAVNKMLEQSDLSALVLVEVAAINGVHGEKLGVGAAQRHQEHLRPAQAAHHVR